MTAKDPTGLPGLDAVLKGGYPRGSPVLVAGGPGAGKTVLGLCFARAALDEGDGAVFVTCEEAPRRLLGYMDAFGMEGTRRHDEGRLRFVDLRPRLSDEVAGTYELDVLKLRIDRAVAAVAARRVVIDSLENLRLGLAGGDVRHDLLSLFDHLREAGITALVTASPALAAGSFESYAADCVIHLSQEINDRLMTRYLRVVKMRGTPHGTNEYPFLLDQRGVSLLPVTGTELRSRAPTTRTSTGIAELDTMLGGGYLDTSSIIISGSAGSGKSLLTATLLRAGLESGRRALHISLEESPREVVRNLRSVGIDLAGFVDSGQLEMRSFRSVEAGLENHLIGISALVESKQRDLVVLDPITSLTDLGSPLQVKMMLVRFVSRMKDLGVTLVLTELLADHQGNVSNLNISSQSDVWIKLRQVVEKDTVSRRIQVVKARGSATTDRVDRFTITGSGIQLG